MKKIIPSCIVKLSYTIGFLFAFSISYSQTPFTVWNYEPVQGTVVNPTPNIGAGTSAVVNVPVTGTNPQMRSGMLSPGCGTQNGSAAGAWALEPFDPGVINESRGAQFNSSTVGYQNIFFSWDQRWSNTAPNTARLQYTTDGTTWTNFLMTGANTTFCLGAINANGCFETTATGDLYRRVRVDLSAITGANNNPNFGIRILAAHYQSTGQFRQTAAPGTIAGTAGTWRFDNVTFAGTLLPGPTASVISAVAPSTICAGGTANIVVNITGGTGPFTVVYFNGSVNATQFLYTSGTNIPVTPAAGANTTYTLVSVTNANGQPGTGNSGSAVITVRPVITVTASNYASCAGAVNLNASTSVTFSPAGGTLTYSTSITNPTAYVGGTISSYTYTYTYLGCSVTSAPVTFTRYNATPTVVTHPSTTPQVVCGNAPFPTLTIVGSADTTSYQWYSDNPVTAITGATSASYTPPNNFVGPKRFRCRIYNNCSNIYTNYSGIHTVKTLRWNGTAWQTYNGTIWTTTGAGVPDIGTDVIFQGNYSSSGDLNACSVVVNTGTVTFNPNHTLTIQNGLTVAGGSLIFENDASLVQVNNIANSGSVTYKRDTMPVRIFDYTYWSSPVNSQFIGTFSPQTQPDKYYWWNTSASVYNWSSIALPATTAMVVGRGYIIRSPNTFNAVTPAIFNGAFIGTPNNGNYTVPMVISVAGDLNLIGNPYPSALDADLFLSNTGPNANIVDGTIYLWTHNTPITSQQYAATDYAMYNSFGGVGVGLGTAGGGTGNLNVPDRYVAAGQGFFAKAINSGGTATFTNAMRANGNNSNFYRYNILQQSVIEKHRIWLEMKNNDGAFKQILVGYAENATDERDRDFDGDAVVTDNIIGLYTFIAEKKYGIQALALPFNMNDQITVGYKSGVAGMFEIGLSDFDGMFTDQDIFIEDKLLNVVHNLKQGNYSFTTAIGTFDSRFVLRFTGSTLNTKSFNDNEVVIYNDKNDIIINSGTRTMANVKLYDMSGRLIYQKGSTNGTQAIVPTSLSNDIFILQIEFSDGQIINRKIIN